MLRRTWQTAMIGFARSARAKSFMQNSRATSRLATRYVAGTSTEAGIERARRLYDESGIRSSLFYLGEYAATITAVNASVAAKLAAAELLGHAGLDVHISLDPTQIGYGMNDARCRNNAFAIAEAIARASNNRIGVHCVMLDMEDDTCVDFTISLHNELLDTQLPAAITLQAYLRRTEDDLHDLIDKGAKVRIVNGAFAAGRDIAFTARREIKENYRRLVGILLSREARDRGVYPSIATHDESLHVHAIECAGKNGWESGEFEFEMLLGVRSDVAMQLARMGQRVRLYVPFGHDWWPHAVRRIGENPRNAWLLARSVLSSS